MRIYISGPMTGMKDLNHLAFIAAQRDIQALGYDVFSPHEAPTFSTWEEYMRFDIAQLLTCEGIAMLPGWELSRGAQLEKQIATALGMPVWFGTALLQKGGAEL